MFGFSIMPIPEPPNMSTSVGSNGSTYSPITMSPFWPRIARLLIAFLFSVFGTLMNGFFLSTFCLDTSIRKIGNVFLVCAGIADMMITAAVMPIVTVVLVSGEGETIYLCKFLQFLTQTAVYAFSLNFAFVGAENYVRLCRSQKEYKIFCSMGIEVLAVVLIIVSMTVAGIGVYMDLDYDYCRREHEGNYHFKLLTSIFFTIVPSFAVYGFLILTFFFIRNKVRRQSRYKRSHIYDQDCSIVASNLLAYTLYILAWVPYFVIVNRYPSASDSTFYNTALTGVTRSVAFGLSYGAIDRNYRNTYGQLFNYLCCKVDLSYPRSGRYRHRAYTPPRDVRVHIMHRALEHHHHHHRYNSQDTHSL